MTELVSEDRKATESRLAIGQIVSCIDCFDKIIEGEVVSFDIPFRVLVIKYPSLNKKPNLFTFKIINMTHTKELKIIKEASGPPKPLTNLNYVKLASRIKNSLEEKTRKVQHLGVGVSPLAQNLLDAIFKIIPDICWEKENIVVLNQVTIKPPYGSEDCFGSDGCQALHLVRNLVEKFHRNPPPPSPTEK